ncbi:MAG: hypothetical protein EB120_04870, partial [Proteobacteria bacterium]|nr:hypothetical protein [Pseudomonadota bacterium]
MRNRDYFLPSISSVIVFGLIWFLSCAHQNRMREEGDAGFEDAASAEQTEPQAEMAQADAATSETQAQATEGNEKTPQEEPASETPTAENQNAAPQENAGEMASAEVPPSTSEPVAEPKMEEPSVDQVQISEPVPTPRVWVSRLPKIPSRALKRKGSHLNRFYFSRKGDTPKSVSQLLYSDTQHAKKLVAWNGKNWVPGKLLFYTSPVDPAEKT